MGVTLSTALPTLFTVNLKLTEKKEDGEVENDHSWLEPELEAKVRSVARASVDLV